MDDRILSRSRSHSIATDLEPVSRLKLVNRDVFVCIRSTIYLFTAAVPADSGRGCESDEGCQKEDR